MRRSLDEVWWRLRVVAFALVVELLLRATTLSRTSEVLHVPLGTDSPAAPFRTEPLPRWAGLRLQAVDSVVSRWPWGDTCLRRSLLTAVALRPLSPVVRLGWLPTSEGGNAHAWVEVEGSSLDSQLEGILPFETR